MSGEAPLITISKKLFVLSEIKEENKLEDKVGSGVKTKAKQLAKHYIKARSLYFKSKAGEPISASSKDFKYLIKAIEILGRIDCTYKVFMNAQIKGLSWANKGKGIFPSYRQLGTDGAEARLLEYLQEQKVETSSNYLSNTPLVDNDDYIDAWYDFLAGKATLKQMKYIRKCQKARDGKVQPKVKAHIKKLKEEEKG